MAASRSSAASSKTCALVAEQPRPGRGARHPAARVRRRAATCASTADLEPVKLTRPAQLTVYRLVQEALTNIAKYAKANDASRSRWRRRRRRGASLGARRRRRLRRRIARDRRARPDRHALPGRGRRRRDAATSAPGEGTLIEATLPSRADSTTPSRQPPAPKSPSARAGRRARSRRAVGSVLRGPGRSPDRSAARVPYRCRRGAAATDSLLSALSLLPATPTPTPITRARNRHEHRQQHQQAARPARPGPCRQGRRHSAQSAIRSTQNAADGALDSLSDKVEDLRDQAAPLLNRVSSQAEAAARRGIEAVRDTSQQLRDKAPARLGQRRRLRQGRAHQGDADRRRDRRGADGPGRPDEPLARLTSIAHAFAQPRHDPSAAQPHRHRSRRSARRPRRGLCRAGRRRGQEDGHDLGCAPGCTQRPLCLVCVGPGLRPAWR